MSRSSSSEKTELKIVDKRLLVGADPNDPSMYTELPNAQEKKAKQLPDPTGYRILCHPIAKEKKTEGGVIKADITLDHEDLLSVVLFVAKMGPDCYKDEKRFPSGPYCKEGDIIIARAHAGRRLKIHNQEWRIINDDEVEATVEDPRGISRA